MTTIAHVHARQILDSRGRPTVEVDIRTSDGHLGRAAVPSGASTGSAEAHELRDGNPAYYGGLGVRRAVDHVNSTIREALIGRDVDDQPGIDRLLLELDGTPQLSTLGANAILGTSLAVCRTAAEAGGQQLYQRLAQLHGSARPTVPMPMVNILSGGLHAGRGMDVQDFLAIPASAQSIDEALELIGRLRSAAADVMTDDGLSTLLADEGGLSPGCETGRDALDLLERACVRAGLGFGEDIKVAIDVAAHSLWDSATHTYHLAREGRRVDTGEMIEMVASWVGDYPIVSIEDPLDEEDWAGWTTLTQQVGHRTNLIGDDLFTTNRDRLRYGITTGAANGILIKVNQNGTLTGTLDVIDDASAANYIPVVSARSGETEDTFISDLAVATGVGQIKIGSVRCSDRLAKYNQLLRIAEDTTLEFAGMTAFPALQHNSTTASTR
ncbi:phosphopyruvate hydratase [Gordonia sp. CPCC 205515]|uniref:phosphopyruvate hydratase n=1 Tax=Gordonia sp. CPCC 205515 TaxID=3140791 RepID=UPI003AF3D383